MWIATAVSRYSLVCVRRTLVTGIFALWASLAFAATEEEPALLERMKVPFTGDLAEMRKRGFIRVLVSYNMTNFFIDGGRHHGFEYELIHRYERSLNESSGAERTRVRVFFVPTPFEQLIPALVRGEGDIAAAGLTITSERSKAVAFTAPYIEHVDELVVTHGRQPAIESLDALAGRMVYVLRGSSYVEHLGGLSAELESRGLEPIDIVAADKYLQTEDILELVNAGVIDLTVADSHLAQAWSQVLDNLEVHSALKVNQGGRIAWAVRPSNPELLESLNGYLESNRRGTLVGNVLFKRYFRNEHWIANPIAEKEIFKLRNLSDLFRKYGERYGFDWLALGAQAYQESRLDHSVRSSAGAVGIMQILPTTARDKNVGIPDISELEENIHAGSKYLDFLRNRYFSEEEIDPESRLHFSLAAYNAGPARVARFRKRAQDRGLDPNRWFRNVEHAALEIAGREPVAYVANIHKYYVAYKLADGLNRKRREKLGKMQAEKEEP